MDKIKEKESMYDFYSDTKSIPTKAMLESIVSAPLGDEQKAEDPQQQSWKHGSPTCSEKKRPSS